MTPTPTPGKTAPNPVPVLDVPDEFDDDLTYLLRQVEHEREFDEADPFAYPPVR